MGIGRSPVHVSRQILREEEDDEAEEYGCPDGSMIAGDQRTVFVDELPEDKATAEEEASHHIAIATLYEVDDLEPFISFPATEQQHDETDKVGYRMR